MPELHSGMTQEYRFINKAKILDLGSRVQEFIGLGVPDIMHMLVLCKVTSAREGLPLAEFQAGLESSKSDVAAALALFEKLGLVNVQGVIGKKYRFVRDGKWSEVAGRLVKLWQHPQGHASVLEAIKQAIVAKQARKPGG